MATQRKSSSAHQPTLSEPAPSEQGSAEQPRSALQVAAMHRALALREAIVSLPYGPAAPADAYRKKHVEARFSPEQANALQRLMSGAELNNSKLPDGRLVKSLADVLLYMVQQVAEEIESADRRRPE